MDYTFTLGEFSGPLETLLELIEARKLEINAVSLAQVTDDFLRHLKSLKTQERSVGKGESREAYLRLLADFIVVASQLVLLKSKSLLPDFTLSEEEEGEVRALEHRLRLYREFKPAIRLLARVWREGPREHARKYFFLALCGNGHMFYPGSHLTIGILVHAIRLIAKDLEGFIAERETVRERIISIEEKIAEVVEVLRDAGEAQFSSLAAAKPRSEIIILFLALLHLAREQEIMLRQEGHFGDIVIIRH